jgi:antitoxin ParD1/3/4
MLLIAKIENPCYLLDPDIAPREQCMNVSLTQEMEHFISERVASGRYRSASEVVREALRLLQEREKERQIRLDALRAEIDEGVAAMERGESIAGEAFIDEVRERRANRHDR